MQYILSEEEYTRLNEETKGLTEELGRLKAELESEKLRIWPVREMVNEICTHNPECRTDFFRGQRQLASAIQKHLPPWNGREACPQCGAPKKENGVSCSCCDWCIF